MLRTGKWLVSISVGLLLVVPSASAQTSTPHKARHKVHKVPTQQAILPPAPRGPLSQVPLDQLPAAPPQVNFQDGRLSIVAQNSTLGDILREVRKRTGASIDVPASATERVVARLGPAPARDVLATLLNGSSFNYVMVGSAADPAVLSSVVLTTRPAAGAQTVAEVYQPSPVYAPPDRTQLGFGRMGPGGYVPNVQPVTPPSNPQAANADDSADDSEDADDSDQDAAESQDQSGATPQPNAGPKSPEEILQMLQQQRQQQPGQPPQPNPPN
ncbi:MAG: hypothetical protein ACHP7J_00905 [Terriglobales bacterium]